MNWPYVTLWSFCAVGEEAMEKFKRLKNEGNDFVKAGDYEEAANKYSECMKLNTEECTVYTNR